MAALIDVDLTDPCAAWPKLYDIYVGLAAGQQETRIRYSDGREVEFGQANLKELGRIISGLKAQCAALQNRRVPRAIRAGFRQRTY